MLLPTKRGGKWWLRSRLPLVAQDLADFLSASLHRAAYLHSLRPTPGATADLHLHAPVRLFFEWDPLVAIANALASHALYRGLLWSLVILLPTLFLGRFFCGWICPMGTLQHFVGNMPSESKRGKQRIESNRYKRWQTVKVRRADRRAGGCVLWFDGDWLARSIQPAGAFDRPGIAAGVQLCSALGSCCRSSTAMWRRSRRRAKRCTLFSAATVLDFRQAHFAQGLVLGVVVSCHSGGEPARDSPVVPFDLPAGRAAGRGFALVDSGAAQRRGELRQMQSLPAELPGRRRSHRRRAVAQVRVPDVHELRGQLSAPEPDFPLLPQRARSSFAGYWAAQERLTGLAAGAAGGSADAREYRAGQEPQRAAAASAGRAG